MKAIQKTMTKTKIEVGRQEQHWFSIFNPSLIKASATPELQYRMYRVRHYEEGEHQLSLVQEATVDTKTVSYLEVKKTENPLLCNGENQINVHYTVVGETAGPVDLMYLVSRTQGLRPNPNLLPCWLNEPSLT